MALGYLAGMNEVLAMSVVVAKGVPALVSCLSNDIATVSGAEDKFPNTISSNNTYGSDDDNKEIAIEYVKAAACWALGQIGKHSPEHAKSLNQHAVLPKLLSVLSSVQPASSISAVAALDDSADKEEPAENDLAADLRLKVILPELTSTVPL
jgi:hypothetical protein